MARHEGRALALGGVEERHGPVRAARRHLVGVVWVDADRVDALRLGRVARSVGPYAHGRDRLGGGEIG